MQAFQHQPHPILPVSSNNASPAVDNESDDEEMESPTTGVKSNTPSASQTSTPTPVPLTFEVDFDPQPSPSPSAHFHSKLQIADSIELGRIAAERLSLQRDSPALSLSKAPWGAWGEIDHTKLEVRGGAYLRDGKKISAAVPMFELLHVDMFYSDDKQAAFHVASQPGNFAYERQQRLLQQLQQQRHEGVEASLVESEVDSSSHTGLLSPLVIVNMVYPGPHNRVMNFVSYYQRRFRTAEAMTRHQLRFREQQQQQPQLSSSSSLPDYGDEELYSKLNIKRVAAFDRVFQRFLQGSDEQRNSCFKILASFAEGPWLARKGVGKKPCLLGKKISQSYHYNQSLNYIEIDADLGSSSFTGPMLKLVKSYTTTTVLDVAWILQGDDESELPESLLAGTRVDHCHIDDILPRDSLRSTTPTTTITD